MPTFLTLVLATLLAAGPAVRPPATVEAIARELVNNFTAGRLKAVTKDFNPDLAAQVTLPTVEQMKEAVAISAGQFRSVISTRQFRHDDKRAVEIICKYERSLISFKFVFDAFDQIAMVYVDPVEAVKVEPPLEMSARKFVTNFAASQFLQATSSFDKGLRQQLTEAKLGELASSLTTRFGKFRSVDEVTQTVEESYRTLSLKTTYDNGPVEFLIAFNSVGTISGVRIAPMKKKPAA